MKCRRKNSPHSLSSYKRRNKLQQVVLSLFKLYEFFKKSKLLNSCALKYIDKLNFVAFRSVRLQQGKLQEKKKTKGERTFSKTVLRINGQHFLFKMFLRNWQLIYDEKSAANILEKYAKKTIIERAGLGAPSLLPYLNFMRLQSNNFSLSQENMPIPV